MDYKKIHDILIERARGRVYDSNVYQNHHIIPRHIDKNSSETVPLTFKEHKIIHLLRWKLYNSIPDKLAYCFMNGISEETRKTYSILGGLIGGKNTKENKSGIFADNWDRAVELKRRWSEGIMNASIIQFQTNAKEWGKLSYESGKGIHSPEYDHSLAGKNLWTTGKMDHLIPQMKERALKGGLKSKEMGTNFSSMDPEQHKEIARKGGKASKGKIWYNNGVKSIMIKEPPPNGFIKGRIKIKK